jgi:hypothetical protein
MRELSSNELNDVCGGHAGQGSKPFNNILATMPGAPLKVEQPGFVSAPDRKGWKPFKNIPATSPSSVPAVMM